MDDLQSSKNIKFCAFLRHKNLFPHEVKVISRGKAEYIYAIGATDWQLLKLEFDRSDLLKYADCLDKIKDLAY